MSDGNPTVSCGLTGIDNPGLDALNTSCKAKKEYNITVNAIAFGDFSNRTLMQNIATCGGGNYSFANGTSIISVYEQFANKILETSFSGQTITVSGGDINSKLFPDSYIKYDYVHEENPSGIYISKEKQFDSAYSGSFNIPNNSKIIETKIISYSGSNWTDEVYLNESKIYDLSFYGNIYTELGDPYSINVPNSYIQDNRTKKVNLTTGLSPSIFGPGSINNKIIYKFAKDFSSYSDIVPKIEGCKWNIEFYDGSRTYLGSLPNNCSYNSTIINYSTNDASQLAVYNLLKILDFDNDGRLDYKFTDQDLNIALDKTSGIPFVTNAEIQVRIWR